MSVTHVEVLTEEPSTEVALRFLLPRLLGDVSFRIYPHQCKDDLRKRLPGRLRGYARFLRPDWRVLVVMDRDDDDCLELKKELEAKAGNAGLRTRSRSFENYQVVNRLVIEELEAWYFGDWEAVKAAFPRVPPSIPKKAKYRNPDAIRGGTWEAFEAVLRRAGYFRSGLRKIEAARAVAYHWDPDRNRSHSFKVFCDAVRDLTASAGP